MAELTGADIGIIVAIVVFTIIFIIVFLVWLGMSRSMPVTPPVTTPVITATAITSLPPLVNDPRPRGNPFNRNISMENPCHDELISQGYEKMNESIKGMALKDDKGGYLHLRPEGHQTTDEPITHFDYDHLTGTLQAHDREKDLTGQVRSIKGTLIPDDHTKGQFALYQKEGRCLLVSDKGDKIATAGGDHFQIQVQR